MQSRLEGAMNVKRARLGMILGLLLFTPPLHGEKAWGNDVLVSRGKYLITIMDCDGCHSGGALAGKPDPKRFLAGSEVGLHGALSGLEDGVFYPSNLTPDKETGLGTWTDKAIIRAIRQGRRPDGRALSPVMPWPTFAVLTDSDAKAIVAYLRTLPPVKFKVPSNVPFEREATAAYWKIVK